MTETVFEAEIYRQGILRAVDVPDEQGASFDGWEYPPVIVMVGGAERATTLVRRTDGGLRLFLHAQLRRAAGADTGDRVRVGLRPDESPQLPLPDDVMQAARQIEMGQAAAELLPPGLRRQILDFVESARRPGTRRKRLTRVRELLRERAAKLHDEPDPER